VTAFNASTGAQEWSTTTSYFSSEPVVSKGEVWVQGAGSVYGLSAKTGAIEVQTGYLDGNGATPAVSKTGVYVSTGCQTQIKLSLAGQVAWEDTTGARAAAAPRPPCGEPRVSGLMGLPQTEGGGDGAAGRQ